MSITPNNASTSIEALSVIAAAGLIWVSALVQHIGNVVQRGPQYVVGDRSVAPPLDGFFGRATRTLANNVESALMWVPPALLVLVWHHTSPLSGLCAVTYICSRTVFSLSYWLRIPVVRSLAWLTGMISCAAVAVIAALPQ